MGSLEDRGATSGRLAEETRFTVSLLALAGAKVLVDVVLLPTTQPIRDWIYADVCE